MACCHTDCIEKPLSKLFMKFGCFIGKHPVYFLIIPLLTSAGLGYGFSFLKQREANDIEDQFTPVNGAAKQEREYVMENFPHNPQGFSSQRLYTEGTYASLIISSGYSMLAPQALDKIQSLNEQILHISVAVGEGQFQYHNICAKVKQECVQNEILEIMNSTGDKIKFPQESIPGGGRVFLGAVLGGVKVDPNGTLQEAHAVQLYYYLQDDMEDVTSVWLKEFLNYCEKLNEAPYKVTYFTSLSRQEELEGNTKQVIPLFSVTYFLAITFSIVSCMRMDNVRNKVWVASFGVLSAGLAVLSSFGLLLLIGVPFAMTAANAPFLILGIGVDDMFILISSWQQTNVHNKVEERMAETYREAAISITITTLTDVLAFYIGCLTPFRSVQSFCLYTGTAVLFCYIYSITFFGAFLALNGRRERSNRHWLTCAKIPSVIPQGSSKWVSVCCVGGGCDEKTGAEVVHPMNNFFRQYYGPLLVRPISKSIVVLLYLGFLAVSIYGCLQIQEGIDLKNLAADDSYVINFYDDKKTYFPTYGPNIMIVVQGVFPYWNKEDRDRLNLSLGKFENLTFIDKSLFLSWLNEYENFAESVSLNIHGEVNFTMYLRGFLNATIFGQDVNFTDQIYASRFFMQTVNIIDAVDEKNMLNKLRETATEESHDGLSLLVYHPAFIFYDQYAVVVENTIQNIVLATAAMLVISLLLIPNPLCSLWVTFAIASVIVGVAGFMALWDVNLDSISMINLVICIGFSVDFSAHISYAFVSNTKPSSNEKAVDALFTLGYPVFQGAVSTILGVVVLSAATSYIFRTFFKIMFLVILFGAIHGLVFIPVFLTFFGICSMSGKVDGKKSQIQLAEGTNIGRHVYENSAYTENPNRPHLPTDSNHNPPPEYTPSNVNAFKPYRSYENGPPEKVHKTDPDCY